MTDFFPNYIRILTVFLFFFFFFLFLSLYLASQLKITDLFSKTILRTELDSRDYKSIILDNDLKVVFICDEETEISGVGLFMDTPFYPFVPLSPSSFHSSSSPSSFPSSSTTSNSFEFDRDLHLLVRRGGGILKTIKNLQGYFFGMTIENVYFLEALDLFANNIISFSSIKKEKGLRKTEEAERIKKEERGLKNMKEEARKEKEEVEKKQIIRIKDEQARLTEFLVRLLGDDFNKYDRLSPIFSSNIASLVIIGNKPIEVLEEWSKTKFSLLENKLVSTNEKISLILPSLILPPHLPLPPSSISSFMPPSSSSPLSSFLFSSPPSTSPSPPSPPPLYYLFEIDLSSVELGEKPLDYIDLLINWAGEGGLEAKLIDMKLILGLKTRMILNRRNAVVYEIKFTLTPLGLASLPLLNSLFSSYLSSLYSSSLLDKLLPLLHQSSLLLFRFQEGGRRREMEGGRGEEAGRKREEEGGGRKEEEEGRDVLEELRVLSFNLGRFPIHNLIVGDGVWNDGKGDKVKEVLTQMRKGGLVILEGDIKANDYLRFYDPLANFNYDLLALSEKNDPTLYNFTKLLQQSLPKDFTLFTPCTPNPLFTLFPPSSSSSSITPSSPLFLSPSSLLIPSSSSLLPPSSSSSILLPSSFLPSQSPSIFQNSPFSSSCSFASVSSSLLPSPPSLILSSSRFSLYFLLDRSFSLPKAHSFLLLRNPIKGIKSFLTIILLARIWNARLHREEGILSILSSSFSSTSPNSISSSSSFSSSSSQPSSPSSLSFSSSFSAEACVEGVLLKWNGFSDMLSESIIKLAEVVRRRKVKENEEEKDNNILEEEVRKEVDRKKYGINSEEKANKEEWKRRKEEVNNNEKKLTRSDKEKESSKWDEILGGKRENEERRNESEIRRRENEGRRNEEDEFIMVKEEVVSKIVWLTDEVHLSKLILEKILKGSESYFTPKEILKGLESFNYDEFKFHEKEFWAKVGLKTFFIGNLMNYTAVKIMDDFWRITGGRELKVEKREKSMEMGARKEKERKDKGSKEGEQEEKKEEEEEDRKEEGEAKKVGGRASEEVGRNSSEVKGREKGNENDENKSKNITKAIIEKSEINRNCSHKGILYVINDITSTGSSLSSLVHFYLPSSSSSDVSMLTSLFILSSSLEAFASETLSIQKDEKIEITVMQDKLMVGLYIYLRKQSEKIKEKDEKEGGEERLKGASSAILNLTTDNKIANQLPPLINSSTSKSGTFLLEHTIQVLISSYTKHLEAMSEESFANLRMTGLVAWKRKEGSLWEKAGRLWKEIYFGEEEWDRREKMREHLKNLGKVEYVRFLKDFFGGKVVVLSFREEEGRRMEEEGYFRKKIEEVKREEGEDGMIREDGEMRRYEGETVDEKEEI